MNNPKNVVLGIDAGTHGIRILAIAFPEGNVIAGSESFYTRKIETGGIQELAVSALETAFEQALDQLTLPEEVHVSGLGVTHQRGPIAAVNEAGEALMDFWCDSDERALDAEGFREQGLDPNEYYELTGCPVVSFNGYSKILWIRKHLPQIADQAYAWVSPQDYLISRLLGRVCLSEGAVLRSGFLNVKERTIAGGLPGISEAVPMTAAGECCGTVSKGWSEKHPYLEGTKVFAVPGDQPAAALFCGIGYGAGERIAAMNMGTTFVGSTAAEKPVRDIDGLVTTEVMPDRKYSPEFGTGSGGQFMDFLTKILYGKVPSGAADWKTMDEEAMKVPAGSQGLRIVPLLWQVTSSGIDGRMTGLRPEHTRSHFIRAAYEGLAYEARLSLDRLARYTGKVQVLRVFGGLSRQDGFLQILSSVLGIPVEAAAESQGSAFGAAEVCAMGLGLIGQPPVFEKRIVCLPQEEERAIYESEFERYCSGR